MPTTTWSDTFIGADLTPLASHTMDTGQSYVRVSPDDGSAVTYLALDGAGNVYCPGFHDDAQYKIDASAPYPIIQSVQADLIGPTNASCTATLQLDLRSKADLSDGFTCGFAIIGSNGLDEIQIDIFRTQDHEDEQHILGIPIIEGDPVTCKLEILSCTQAKAYVNGVLKATINTSVSPEVPSGGSVLVGLSRNALGTSAEQGRFTNLEVVFTEGGSTCGGECTLSLLPATATIDLGDIDPTVELTASEECDFTVDGGSLSLASGTTTVFTPDATGTFTVTATDTATGLCTDTCVITVTQNGEDGTVSCTGEPSTQLWMLTGNRLIGRWQDSATRDFMVDEDLTTGEAIPDWVYSTGFDHTPAPAVVKSLLVDADGPVKVTTAKTVAAEVPAQAREFDAVPVPDQDEIEVPGASDFRALKMRVEFSGANGTELRAAGWSREAVNAKGG